MREKKPQKEINDLENYVKETLDRFATEFILDDELTNLEDIVTGALTELTDLEKNFAEIISSSSENHVNKDSNYLLAVRRFQNAMNVALWDGANRRDMKTYEEGFNFYDNALDIVSATGNKDEIDLVRTEFAQALIKITAKDENINDPIFIPFFLKACKSLAELYDSFGNFETSSNFHIKAAELISENPVMSELEYFQAIITSILSNDIENARKIIEKLQLRHFIRFANQLMNAINEKNYEMIKEIEGKIEVLANQRRLKSKNVVFLFDLLIQQMKKSVEKSSVESLQVPENVAPLSDEKVQEIKKSLAKGIQQLQIAFPNIDIPITAQLDTSHIVSELKEMITTEISKEIKSLSNEIVSKILSKLPTGGGGSYSQPRSAGNISDEDMPEIQAIEGGAREKTKRPKLDDMLDSIIVSE